MQGQLDEPAGSKDFHIYMFEKYGVLDWQLDLCDTDFIDQLQAKWRAEAFVKSLEEKRAKVRENLKERTGR